MKKSQVDGIIAVVRHNGKVLFLRRANHMEYEGGKWGFVGGLVNDGENMEEALMREVKEESGLNVTNIRFFNNYRFDFLAQSKDEIRTANLHVFVCDTDSDVVSLDHESSEFKWLELEKGKELELVKGNEVMIDDLREKVN